MTKCRHDQENNITCQNSKRKQHTPPEYSSRPALTMRTAAHSHHTVTCRNVITSAVRPPWHMLMSFPLPKSDVGAQVQAAPHTGELRTNAKAVERGCLCHSAMLTKGRVITLLSQPRPSPAACAMQHANESRGTSATAHTAAGTKPTSVSLPSHPAPMQPKCLAQAQTAFSSWSVAAE